MALCVLYSIPQAKKAGRDWTTTLTALRTNEATLIAVDERTFIFQLSEPRLTEGAPHARCEAGHVPD
jgi:hypothetical protein